MAAPPCDCTCNLQNPVLPPLPASAPARRPHPARCCSQDIVSELPERFFVAEIIRKHIFLQYRDEVPYNVAGGCTREAGRVGPRRAACRPPKYRRCLPPTGAEPCTSCLVPSVRSGGD